MPPSDVKLDEPCRVAVYARVTDIDGDPLERPITLGRDVCARFLMRDLQDTIVASRGYDAVHYPPNFDSEKDIRRYFLFDLGVTGRLSLEELAKLPHYVFLATKQAGVWLVNSICLPRIKLTMPQAVCWSTVCCAESSAANKGLRVGRRRGTRDFPRARIRS